MTHYLHYIRPKTAIRSRGVLDDHTASDQPQFKHVAPGDVLWMVSILDGSLTLCWRFPVGSVVSEREAQRLLGRDHVWPGKYHAVTPARERVENREIDINDIALSLRFKGGVDRLPPKFTGQHLQVLRKLTDESADVLETAWRQRRPRARG